MKSGSNLETILHRGGFAITAELSQPEHSDPGALREQIRCLAPVVDALNFVDNPLGQPRLSSLAAAALSIEEGVEPVLQVTCRDRNSIAIQADVIGASALGIKNILCLTGDHESLGSHAMAKGVWELDSVQLIQLLHGLRTEGRRRDGSIISPRPRLFLGGAKNPFSAPLVVRTHRLKLKIAAGADFVQTQPVLDVDYFGRWMEQVRAQGLHEKVAIIAGVLVFDSHKVLKFIQKHLPGTRVPEALIQRVEAAKDSAAEALAVARETILALRSMPGVRGLHFMAAGADLAETVPALVHDLEPLLVKGGV